MIFGSPANGERRTGIELEVDEIGASLRYTNAVIAKPSTGRAADPADAGEPAPM